MQYQKIYYPYPRNSLVVCLQFLWWIFILTLLALQTKLFCIQCRSWWDSSLWAVSSGSTLFATMFCFGLRPLFWAMVLTRFKDGKVHFRNVEMKAEISNFWTLSYYSKKLMRTRKNSPDARIYCRLEPRKRVKIQQHLDNAAWLTVSPHMLTQASESN